MSVHTVVCICVRLSTSVTGIGTPLCHKIVAVELTAGSSVCIWVHVSIQSVTFFLPVCHELTGKLCVLQVQAEFACRTYLLSRHVCHGLFVLFARQTLPLAGLSGMGPPTV